MHREQGLVESHRFLALLQDLQALAVVLRDIGLFLIDIEFIDVQNLAPKLFCPSDFPNKKHL